MAGKIRLNITTKLFLIVFCFSALVLISFSVFNYKRSSDAILKHEYEHLLGIRDLKRDMLLDYFDDVNAEVIDHSKSISRELEFLHASNPFDVTRQISLDMIDGGKINIDNYDEWFEAHGLLQDIILVHLENAYTGLSDVMAMLSSDFDVINYYIVNDKGDIIFNPSNLKDGLMNINDTIFEYNGLSECVKKLEEAGTESDAENIVITDFSFYKFFIERPVFFVGTKVRVKDNYGYFVMMVPGTRINKIMTKSIGLGSTGESYVVGEDFKMRSDSRFLTKEPDDFFKQISRYGKGMLALIKTRNTTVLLQEVKTNATIDALKGNSATRIVDDYRDVSVISSYTTLDMGDFRWALLAEIDVKEAFTDIYRLRMNMITISAIIILVLLLFSAILVKTVTRRIILLKESAELVSKGDYSLDIAATGEDEIDELARSFITMTQDLKEKEDELLAKNVMLKGKVIEGAKELDKEKGFSEKIISTAKSFVVGLRQDGRIVLANDAFLEATGNSGNEIVGTNFFKYISNDLKGIKFKAFIKSGAVEKGHFYCDIITKSLEEMSISWDAALLKQPAGAKFIIAIGQDITDRIQLENNLRKKTAEIESFVYSISHDLKNPAISLMGMLDLLSEDCGETISEQGQFYLKRIKTNAIVINDLLSAMLEVSKISNIIDDTVEDFNVGEVVEHIVEESKAYIDEHDAKVTVKGPFADVHFPKLRLYQVLLNLFKNALKFSRDGVPLEVTFGGYDTDEEYICYLKDNGIGIDAEYHVKIFDMFSRLREKDVGGTGIGLTMVKRILEESGGRIWIDSKVGEGCTFYVAIPKKKELPERDNTASKSTDGDLGNAGS